MKNETQNSQQNISDTERVCNTKFQVLLMQGIYENRSKVISAEIFTET